MLHTLCVSVILLSTIGFLSSPSIPFKNKYPKKRKMGIRAEGRMQRREGSLIQEGSTGNVPSGRKVAM